MVSVRLSGVLQYRKSARRVPCVGECLAYLFTRRKHVVGFLLGYRERAVVAQANAFEELRECVGLGFVQGDSQSGVRGKSLVLG